MPIAGKVIDVTHQGFFLVLSGTKIWPNSQWNLGAFFPIFEL